MLFHYFWNGFVIFRAILVKITLHFGTTSTGISTNTTTLNFSWSQKLSHHEFLWLYIMCGTLILFDLESFVLFSCNRFYFKVLILVSNTYTLIIKCFITVRVDWFPFTEQHLKKDKLLSDNNRILFNTHPYYGGGIEDDHIPFLHRSKSSNVFFRLPPLTKTVHTLNL